MVLPWSLQLVLLQLATWRNRLRMRLRMMVLRRRMAVHCLLPLVLVELAARCELAPTQVAAGRQVAVRLEVAARRKLAARRNAR